jgi:integrase
MARSIRSSQLETRTARLKLDKSTSPYFVQLSKGLSLGYRRIDSPRAPWIVRSTIGGKPWQRKFAVADDFEEANGETVLTFWDAQRKAREVARGSGDDDRIAIATVKVAIDRYATDLRSRGGNISNARMARGTLPASILDRPVSLLTTRELRGYRDALLDTRKPGSVNRIVCTLAAALSLAASQDQRITNQSSWKIGLQKLRDAARSRNVVLTEDEVRRVVCAAYEISAQLGRLVETAAVTGARVSQLARIEVSQLQLDRLRVMIPVSRKGRGTKQVRAKPVPIAASLAAKLAQTAEGRASEELLLVKLLGARWGSGDHAEPFAEAVERAGLDPKVVTMNALRHTSITRMLLRSVPIRVVADMHDTSVKMIEATYSASIADHSDQLARAAIFDLDAPPVVVPLRAVHG